MPIEHFKNELPKKYNPQNTSSELLKKTFTIRLKEYKSIWSDISQSEMNAPEQHYIIQGVRGSGKTTLLTRLSIEVEENKALTKWLIPIQFKEEEYGIGSLFGFWLRVAEELEEHFQYGDLFTGLTEDIEAIESDEEDDTKIAFKLLNNALTKNAKKIILFIDNIAELFDNFPSREKAILREVLSQNPNLRIIGGSAISLEAFYDHKDPFYQFFKVITLKQLTKKETIDLLTTLGEAAGNQELQKIKNVIKQNPEKIETIRRLTGGIPRTIVLLFDILAEGPKGSTFEYLDDTLDMTSPIYKHRMDDLTAQQKPIVHAIAQQWDAISVKEIAKKTRISSKTVSAQLAQLQKQWIVEKVPTDTKNHLYRLQERFFNIWYLMRYGRKRDKTKLRWLTRFLEVWCTPEELLQRAKRYSNDLHTNAYLPGTLAYTSALLACKNIDAEEKEAIHNHAHIFFESQGQQHLLKQLPLIDADEHYLQGVKYIEEEQFDKAIISLQKSKDGGTKSVNFKLGIIWHTEIKDFAKAEQAYLDAIKDKDYEAYIILGILYHEALKNVEKAEQAFLNAIEHKFYKAFISLGNLYRNDLKDTKKSEQAYLDAIKQDEHEAYMFLGFLYEYDLKEFGKAEKAYLNAIEHQNYDAFIVLGHLYSDELKEFGKAEKAYLNAVEHQNYDAFIALGRLYCDNLKEFGKAEKAYINAVEHQNYDAFIALGRLYHDNLKEFGKAEKAYINAIKKDEYTAYIFLGFLYHNELKDIDKAKQAYLDAIKHEDYRACIFLGNLYQHDLKDFRNAEQAYLEATMQGDYEAYIFLGLLYRYSLKDIEKAKQAYLKAIEHNHYDAYLDLSNLYCDALKDFDKAEQTALKALEYGVDGTFNSLAWLYFSSEKLDKQEAALAYSQQAIELDTRFETLHTHISVALWNNKLEDAKQHTSRLLSTEYWNEDDFEQTNLIDLFLLFLAKKQTNLVEQWFEEFDLKDRFRPLYFTLMHLMKEKHPNEYLRMGSELTETVDEMLAKIDVLREKYK
jgi:tetratricopeptide (TPR) repeat protein